jgi:type IV pilus assembly protein PilC
MKSRNASKHLFYSEMAKLLEAGFGIRDAAEVMSATGLPAAQAQLLAEMHQGLMDGKSIADSLGGNPQTVSDLERGIITAGERGGRLATAMRHLADYFGMLATARRETLRGLIHPVIVLHLGVFIGTVPTAMLGGGKTTNQVAIGFFTTLLVAYAAAFLAFLGIRALLRAARHNAGIDRAIGRAPLLGKVRSNLAMAGFCKVYHTCLLAGLPMRDTVRMAAEASQSGMIREAAKHLQKLLSDGNPLGPGMIAESAFPKAFARSYATGEAAGTLDTDLANWSRLFQNDAEAGLKMLATVLPKIMYFLMLIYVGWKIVGFYANYAEMLQGIE